MFKDRKEAGLMLAKRLLKYKDSKDTVVIGIPRGGVETAYYVAEKLQLPLDTVVIKKVGFPWQEEAALGAVSVDDYEINLDLARTSGVSDEYLRSEVKKKQKEAKERYKLLCGERKPISLKNKIAILIDDGIAMGATMLMAVKSVKKQLPKKIIVATPIAPLEAVNKLEVDEVVCLEEPRLFMAISQFYERFNQLSDEQAKNFLDLAKKWSRK